MNSGGETKTRDVPLESTETRAELDDLDESSALPKIDRFALLQRIGAGGMGELYTAYDAKLDRKIALKLVRPGRRGKLSDSRLVREAQALAKISHPNVVSVFEVGFAGEQVFVAMEYVRGQTLGAWLDRNQELPEPQRVRELLARFRDAARGLEAVHHAGMAHRDFKPDNVLVGDDGRVRLVDFGLARSTFTPVDAANSDDGEVGEAVVSGLDIDIEEQLTPDIEVGTLTNAGTLLGTPRYMAPEQWLTQRGDARSDQFSFCVSLYHALYGKWPFEAATMAELSALVRGSPPHEPPRKPEVPTRLHAAVLRGLATKPDDRWPDMGELIAAIEQALAPAPRRIRTWSLVAVLVALIVLALSIPRTPGPSFTSESAIARAERELGAELRRVQVFTKIAELDANGKLDEADQMFAAFAALESSAQTGALTRAWLDQARRMSARGDATRQLDALGEALLASSSDDERREPLIELARVQARNHNYELLGATLRVLATRGGEADDAELLTMRVKEALRRRDLASAQALLDRPELANLAAQLGPLLRQLDSVSATGLVVPRPGTDTTAIVELPNLDLDGDLHGDLLAIPESGPARLLASQPNLPPLQELVFDPRLELLRPVAAASGRPGAPNWVVGIGEGRHILFELSREAGRVHAREQLTTQAGDWASGDLFTGPGWDGWEVLGPQFSEHRIIGVRSGGLEPFVPEPSLAALDSLPESLLITDLDGDGADELVVGVDGWWAYDVRVLQPTSDPGTLELLARRKLGGLAGIASFPAPSGRGRQLAVSVPDSPPSPRVFPSDAPAGAATGLYLLAWSGPGQALEIVDHIELPNNFRPGAGDLDGDGHSELVVQLDSAIVILRPGTDLHDTSFWLEGLAYHEIADLDHDGDDELIVSELETGRVLVLGTGVEHLPPRERTADQWVAPPQGLAPDLREPWKRAEVLAMVGLFDRASSALAELARLANERDAAIALHRAGQLLDRNGAKRRAAALYEQAGDLRSLERALELYENVHEFGAAARIADRLAGWPQLDDAKRAAWRASALALHRRAEPEAELVFEFSDPLDDGWRIERPGLVHSESERLRIDSVGASDPVLLRRSFMWLGDRLELDVELEVERLEWGAALVFELIPIDAAGAAAGPSLGRLRIGSQGGGGHFVLDTSDWSVLEPGSINETPRMLGAAPPPGHDHVRMRLDVTDDATTTRISVHALGQDEGHETISLAYQRPIELAARRPGRYELRISTGDEPWMRGVIRLERLSLIGARLDEVVPATRRERVLLALANTNGQLALELLDDADVGELEARDAAWLRALALEQLGHWQQAWPQIARALDRCDDPEAVARFGYALLLLPDRFGPVLRDLCPHDRFSLNTWEVAWSTLFHHPDLADVHRTMTTQLIDLDRCEPTNFEQARACADLLTARARGWYMQNLASAADSDLRRSIELSHAWSEHPELTIDQRATLRRLGSLAHVRLAAMLVARNHLDDAAVELQLALASDSAPEIIADVIVARSLFEPLRSKPVWARVMAAQLGLE